jgi:hypothetical protein
MIASHAPWSEKSVRKTKALSEAGSGFMAIPRQVGAVRRHQSGAVPRTMCAGAAKSAPLGWDEPLEPFVSLEQQRPNPFPTNQPLMLSSTTGSPTRAARSARIRRRSCVGSSIDCARDGASSCDPVAHVDRLLGEGKGRND